MDRPFDMAARTVSPGQIDALIVLLRAEGYAVLGPTPRDGVITLAAISGLGDLPTGITDSQEAGTYRLERGEGPALFGAANGPASWKAFLHPPRERIWSATITDGMPAYTEDPPAETPCAFLGVRACDLAAIAILDRVMAEDPRYQARRRNVFIVAVNCHDAGGTCFCVSTDTGPAAREGYDLALTELIADGPHEILMTPGSAAGHRILSQLTTRPATAEVHARAREATDAARAAMGRTLRTEGLPAAIAAAAESPRWDDVAARCLTCGNCTMVCPTCYCSEMADTADLAGDHAERWREWESCFSLDFSHVAGGSVRRSAASRYRQWLSHKLSTWVDQFGTLGCVGCGRCITWCPVGIDLTEEAAALAAEGGAP